MSIKARRVVIGVSVVVLIIAAIFIGTRPPATPGISELPTTIAESSSAIPAGSATPTASMPVVAPSGTVEAGQTSQPASSGQPAATGNTTQTTQPGSAETPTPETIPTVFDDPSVLLTPFVPLTETPTPLPLKGLSGAIELSVVQLQRIALPDGFLLVADVANPTDQPVKDVSLVFTKSNGARVGDPKPLSLYLLPGDARPGVTSRLAPDDPIIASWDALQAHATGAVITARPDRPGYPVMLDVSYPEVTLNSSSNQYDYRVAVTNNTGMRAAIADQNLAFFSNDGVLLLVVDLGAHAALENGASYTLTGSIPMDQPVAEGRRLVEYTDVLANVSAEIAP